MQERILTSNEIYLGAEALDLLKGDTTKTIETHLGTFCYQDSHIFTFEEGLIGFKDNKNFAIGAVPGMPTHENYGLMQSLDNPALSFILFYPELEDTQLSLIAQKVRIILKTDLAYSHTAPQQINRTNLAVAFLVTITKNEDNTTQVGCVQDAPIVFLNHQKRAWQIVIH